MGLIQILYKGVVLTQIPISISFQGHLIKAALSGAGSQELQVCHMWKQSKVGASDMGGMASDSTTDGLLQVRYVPSAVDELLVGDFITLEHVAIFNVKSTNDGETAIIPSSPISSIGSQPPSSGTTRPSTLSITGLAPILVVPMIQPSTGTLSMVDRVSVFISGMTPLTASLAFTTAAPDNAGTMRPAVASLAFTGIVPAVRTPLIQPSVGTLTLTTTTPTVRAPIVRPSVGTLSTTGTAASITKSNSIRPSIASLNFVGRDPFSVESGEHHIGEDGEWTDLDDFSTQQLNGDGDNLFEVYLGEDPNQTVLEYPGTGNKIFRILGGSGDEIYWHFFPRDGGYIFPNGYMQNYITGSAPSSWDNVNRLQLLVRPSVPQTRSSSGSDNLQIGTYIRDHADGDSSNQGAHYYHLFDPNWIADRWHLVIINRKPQHQVGGGGGTEWGLDPEFGGAENVHYFDGLTRWYFDTTFDNTGEIWSFKGPEIGIVTGTEDNEISSIVAVYTGTRYEVSWAAIKNTSRNFDVRYSTYSMKVNGFTSGADAGTVSNPNSDYTGTFWFSPNISEVNPGIYIAIRRQGATDFTELWIPYNMGQ